jgi:hypothetical protein
MPLLVASMGLRQSSADFLGQPSVDTLVSVRATSLFGGSLLGAKIEASSTDGTFRAAGFADTNGVFEFHCPPGVRLTIAADVKGFVKERVVVVPGGGPTNWIEVGLVPGMDDIPVAELAGELRAADGSLLGGGRVSLEATYNRRVSAVAKVLSSGRYSILVPKPGLYAVRATAHGFRDTTIVLAVPPELPRRGIRLDFELHR